MRFKPPNCKRLQGAEDARRRVRRRTFVLQVPDNKADTVPCECLQLFICGQLGKTTVGVETGDPFEFTVRKRTSWGHYGDIHDQQ